ncbi:MAG: Uma2 family endonuclease [Verrucomicrobiota bacterium]
MSYIPKHSVQDYLAWEGDWELWDGVPVSMAPSPDFGHQTAGMELSGEIRSQLKSQPCDGQCQVLYEIDWQIDGHTVVRPDIMVICHKPTGKWVEQAPVLVVEILSPATRHKDLTAKKELYAKNGVKFYLIVDHETQNFISLMLDPEGTYRERPITDPLELHRECSISIEPSVIFPN